MWGVTYEGALTCDRLQIIENDRVLAKCTLQLTRGHTIVVDTLININTSTHGVSSGSHHSKLARRKCGVDPTSRGATSGS